MRYVIFCGVLITVFTSACVAQLNPSAVESKRVRQSTPHSDITSSSQEATSLSSVDSTFLFEKKEPPRILTQPRASRPPNSGTVCTQGSVLLKVELLHDGTIGKIMVVRGLPHGFSEQAMLAAEKITFIPASRGGIPVTTIKIFEYPFGIYH